MKKTLLTILCALATTLGFAQTETHYTEQYVVTFGGTTQAPQTADIIIVDNGDGTINFVLRDFTFNFSGQNIAVGDIQSDDIPVEEGEDGLSYFANEGTFSIPADKLPAQLKLFASMFEEIYYDLGGYYNSKRLYAHININLMDGVEVEVGDDDISGGVRTYIEELIVTINGDSSEPQEAAVKVYDNGDGTINFELQNFMLANGEDVIPVGNIRVDNIATEEGADGLTHFAFTGNINIKEGDLEDVGMWFGPMLGDIPVVLKGKLNDEKLFVTIDIDMQKTLNQIIHVQLGTDDFEPAALTGDLNGDGTVDIADAVSVLNIMAEDGYSPAADINEDETVDIADFVSILNIMAEQ